MASTSSTDHAIENISFRPDDLVIPVMGMYGSGKTTFIEMCSLPHSDQSPTKLSLDTETSLNIYSIPYRGKTVHLINVPGLGSVDREDEDIVEEWAYWLIKAYGTGLFFNGVIYLHPISVPKFSGSMNRSLQLFKALCGKENYPAVVLATTHWDRIEPAEGDFRVDQMVSKNEFWGDMFDAGTNIEAVHDQKSCFMILDLFFELERDKVLQIQDEIIHKNMALHHTAAGRILYERWLNEKDQLEKVLHLAKADLTQELDIIHQGQIMEQLEQQDFLQRELTKLQNANRNSLMSLWDVKVQNDFNRIQTELDLTKSQLSNLEQYQMQLQFSGRTISKKEKAQFEKELRLLRKKATVLQKTRVYRVEPNPLWMDATKITIAIGAGILPALACTIM